MFGASDFQNSLESHSLDLHIINWYRQNIKISKFENALHSENFNGTIFRKHIMKQYFYHH